MSIKRFELGVGRRAPVAPEERARLDSITDEEIEAAALSDPDNPPLTDEQLKQMRRPAGLARDVGRA